MPCYAIRYRHSKGVYVASKWADTASLALEAVKSTHRRIGLSSAVGLIVYDDPELAMPEPFSEESRSLRRNVSPVATVVESRPSEVEVHFGERDDHETPPEGSDSNDTDGRPIAA